MSNPSWKMTESIAMRPARSIRPAAAEAKGRRVVKSATSEPRVTLAPDLHRRDAPLGEGRLRRGQPGKGHPVRRAGHVGEPELVAEGDRAAVAAVLAADSELDLGIDSAGALDGDPHQVADPASVERLERVCLEDAVLEIAGEEHPLRVVARETERRLREVVRAEAEEVGFRGELVGPNARPRQLDHRADEVLELAVGLLELGRGRVERQVAQPPELFGEAHERM